MVPDGSDRCPDLRPWASEILRRNGPSVGENACDDVFGWADRDLGRITFARKADGEWLPVTAGQFAARVAAVAVGLIAGGIRPGDRSA